MEKFSIVLMDLIYYFAMERNGEDRRMNPIDRITGNRIRCILCGSEYHVVGSCPHHKKKRRNDVYYLIYLSWVNAALLCAIIAILLIRG